MKWTEIVVFQRKAEGEFFTKKNLNLDEGNVNFGDKVVVSNFNTVLGKFSCGIKVSYR